MLGEYSRSFERELFRSFLYDSPHRRVCDDVEDEVDRTDIRWDYEYSNEPQVDEATLFLLVTKIVKYTLLMGMSDYPCRESWQSWDDRLQPFHALEYGIAISDEVVRRDTQLYIAFDVLAETLSRHTTYRLTADFLRRFMTTFLPQQKVETTRIGGVEIETYYCFDDDTSLADYFFFHPCLPRYYLPHYEDKANDHINVLHVHSLKDILDYKGVIFTANDGFVDCLVNDPVVRSFLRVTRGGDAPFSVPCVFVNGVSLDYEEDSPYEFDKRKEREDVERMKQLAREWHLQPALQSVNSIAIIGPDWAFWKKLLLGALAVYRDDE